MVSMVPESLSMCRQDVGSLLTTLFNPDRPTVEFWSRSCLFLFPSQSDKVSFYFKMKHNINFVIHMNEYKPVSTLFSNAKILYLIFACYPGSCGLLAWVERGGFNVRCYWSVPRVSSVSTSLVWLALWFFDFLSLWLSINRNLTLLGSWSQTSEVLHSLWAKTPYSHLSAATWGFLL